METNITEFPTNGNQPSSCENCAAYKENAERAYEAVQRFAQTRQEAINLQKQVKDLNTVLQDRQEYVMDLKKKLEAEKERSTRFEKELSEKQVELDCTKEQLEFVKAEADKNKELAEKTVNHEKKLNDMQKQLEETKESHSKICKRMFNLANTVQNYQKRYGVLNLTQVPNDQPSTSLQSVDEPNDRKVIKPRRGRAPKNPKNKAAKKSKPDQASRPVELSKEALMAELDSSDDLNSTELVIDEEEPFDEEPQSSNNDSPSAEPAQTSHSNELNKEALMAELDSSDEDLNSAELVIDEEEPFDEESKRGNDDDLSNFNLRPARTRLARRQLLRPNKSAQQQKAKASRIASSTSQHQPNDSAKMPPPRSIPRRTQTRTSSSTTVTQNAVITKELRSRTISTSSDDLDLPKQNRTRRLSSTSSTSSASVSPPKSLRSAKREILAEAQQPTTSKPSLLNSPTKIRSPPRKKQKEEVAKPSNINTEHAVDKSEVPKSIPDQIEEASTKIVSESTETSKQSNTAPNKSNSTSKSTVITRKRRVENPAPIVTKTPVTKTSQARPLSPRRALLIDIPAQNPQRKMRTTRMQTARSSAASTSVSAKQPNSTFNFITAVLRDFTTKKVSMRDALKRFNSEIEKHGGDNSLPTDQFADILCRFIRGENFGDLWFVLKQSAKKSTGQEALLSGAERHFFEFIYDLNSNNNGERWPGIFLKLAQTLCSDCERSSASSFVQKCQDVRVMMCALFFSDQHEKADETERSACIKQINTLVDRLVDEDDASTVVRVLCFIYTTNGNFLFHQFLNLATMPITRMQRVRQHLANSSADANTFFALIQKDVPENLVEALRQPLEQKASDNVE